MNHHWQQSLSEWVHQYPRVMGITGAGISAGSGIPTYRDAEGNWQSREPIQHNDFIKDPFQRQRYWSRSAVGWPTMPWPNSNKPEQLIYSSPKMSIGSTNARVSNRSSTCTAAWTR